MVEETTSALWGRTRVRPTVITVLFALVAVLTVIAPGGVQDGLALGLLRGVALGVVIVDPLTAFRRLSAFTPGAIRGPSRVAQGEPVDLHLADATVAPGVDAAISVGTTDSVPLVDAVDGLPARPIASRRGRHQAVAMEVSAISTVGFLRVTRKGFVPLASPMWVCPVALESVPLDSVLGHAPGRHALTPARQGDLTRGVRPMVDGDLIRHAHWPATARRGAVHVREFERPADLVVAVVVELTGEPPVDDAIAGRALGTVTELMVRGARVDLHGCRPDGPAGLEDVDEHRAAQFLAEVVSGPTSVPAGAVPTLVIDAASVGRSVSGAHR